MHSEKVTYMVKVIRFFGIILFLAIILALLNWLPSIIQKHELKRFGSIEAARKTLAVNKIYLPTYMPDHLGLAWTPAEIYAQNSPFNAVIMHFRYKDREETGLIIQQADAKAEYSLEPRIKIERKNERSVFVKGRKALLVAAVCDSDIPCNQLSWNESGTVITLTGKFAAQEIIKIAASVVPAE